MWCCDMHPDCWVHSEVWWEGCCMVRVSCLRTNCCCTASEAALTMHPHHRPSDFPRRRCHAAKVVHHLRNVLGFRRCRLCRHFIWTCGQAGLLVHTESHTAVPGKACMLPGWGVRQVAIVCCERYPVVLQHSLLHGCMWHSDA